MKQIAKSYKELEKLVLESKSFVEVTKDLYFDSLEVLPPIWLENGCFMVDEPKINDIYHVFGKKEGKYFGCLCNKSFALKNFDA